MSAQSLLRDSSCAQNTAHKSLPTQKNTKLYGRHRTPYNLVFIWCFNLQNGQLRKVTIHIFECHKSQQYGTFQHFKLRYGGNKLLLEKVNLKTDNTCLKACHGVIHISKPPRFGLPQHQSLALLAQPGTEIGVRDSRQSLCSFPHRGSS